MSNRIARRAGLVLRALLALAVAGLAGATLVPSALAQTVTINATSGAGGTIMPKGKVQVPVGGSQRFDIVPGAGYSIKSVAVNGRALGAPASYTFTDVRTAQTIKATFQVATHTITVATSGGFTAKPVSNGTISAKHGKTLRFTITPGGGTRPEVTVDGQTVAVSSTAKSYSFALRVTGPHRVVIGLAREVLAIQKSGSGSGTVTSNPAGIDCGGTCSASFPRGQSVTLTASPAAGSTFAGWSGGGCSGTGPACTVSLASSAAVTARFDAVTPRYALTIAKSGTGAGTVTSSPAGIDCGADCSESWDAGQQVTLTAAPASGSSFAGWSGGACAGTNPVCQLTMNAAVSVTAAFQAGAPVSDQTIADLALAGHVTASAAYAALEFAVRGVWEASTQAGQPTFTGTLTQVGTTEQFTYTPDADRQAGRGLHQRRTDRDPGDPLHGLHRRRLERLHEGPRRRLRVLLGQRREHPDGEPDAPRHGRGLPVDPHLPGRDGRPRARPARPPEGRREREELLPGDRLQLRDDSNTTPARWGWRAGPRRSTTRPGR